MKLLLDTNAYTAFMLGNDEVVAQVRASETIIMSPFVMGELLYGFRNGNRFDANLALLKSFLAHPYVQELEVTYQTADRYSRIAAALRKKGKPIPTNDIWIAAHTMELGAELLSRDKHFAEIDALPWIPWGSEEG